MPMLRSNGRYYVKRNFPGIRKINRSLQTRRRGLAQRREDALLSLHRQGHHGVVRAFADGDVSIQAVQEAYETSRVSELAADLRRGSSTLVDACEAALVHKAPDVKDSTLERYRYSLGHLRAFHGDGADVAAVLSENAVQRFKSHRLDDGAAKETVNNDIGAVSILVTYAMKQGWIDERPEIKRFDYKARIRYLNGDQLAVYFAALRPAFMVQMMLLVGTGMRLGESEALRACDLRLGEGDNRAMIEDSKTSTGVRTVFVPEWAAEAVAAHVAENSLSGTDQVFSIPRPTVQDEHNRARKMVDPDYTIHDHRHTAAVHLARAGIAMPLLQQQLGHKHIEMTMKYARFHPEYSDVADSFKRAGDSLGLGSGNKAGNTPSEADAEKVASETA